MNQLFGLQHRRSENGSNFPQSEKLIKPSKTLNFYSIFKSLYYSRPLSLQRHTPYLQVGEGALNLSFLFFPGS